MSWQVRDNSTELQKLRREANKIRDALFINGFGTNIVGSSNPGGASGSQNPTGGGGQSGMIASKPTIHNITDVDTGGVSTGVFDKVQLRTSSVIVDHTGALDVKFIQGTINDGTIVYMKPKDGKQITLKTGGNIDIATDLFVNDNQCAILVFFEDNQSPDSNGNYVVATISSAGGGGGGLNTNLDNLANPTTPNKNIEMNGFAITELAFLESLTANPGNAGLLRNGNNQILFSSRNSTNTGQLEAKFDSNNIFDITRDDNADVLVALRAQDATFPDVSLIIASRHVGALGGEGELAHPNKIFFKTGALGDIIFKIDDTGTGSGGLGKFVFDPTNIGLALDMNLKILFQPTSILFTEFGVANNGKEIGNFVTGLGVSFEDPVQDWFWSWRDTLLVDRLHREDGIAGIVGGSNTSVPIVRWRIKARTNKQIGFQVTDESVTSGSDGVVGNVGTIQIPRLTGFPSPFTAAEFDNLFGNIIGAIGVINTSGTPTLVVRRDNGQWFGVTLGLVV